MSQTDNELIAQYIERDPVQPGIARARLIDSCVPIWALIGYYLYAAEGNVALTAHDYHITADEMAAALAYYAQHQDYIDAFLLLNNDY